MHLRVPTWISAGIASNRIPRGSSARIQAVLKSFGPRNHVRLILSHGLVSGAADSACLSGDLKRRYRESSEVDLTELAAVRRSFILEFASNEQNSDFNRD